MPVYICYQYCQNPAYIRRSGVRLTEEADLAYDEDAPPVLLGEDRGANAGEYALVSQ
jgi:hypothetical protein